MRHFDTWLVRDPYSITQYYPPERTGGRWWSKAIRELISTRQICAPAPSPTPVPVSHSQTQTKPQTKSPLFTHLPPELRLIIWSHVFNIDPNTPSVLHLVTIRNRIHHVRCAHPHPCAIDQNRRCCPASAARWRTDTQTDESTKLYPHTHPALPSHLSNGNPSLLRTCRAIYNEAAPLLYETVTFDADDLGTLIAFLGQVSPGCLRVVRGVRVQVVPLGGFYNIHTHTHSPHLWRTLWHFIATRLLNLDDLSLCIDLGRFIGTAQGGVVGGFRIPLEETAEWVAPLLRVRGLRRFELGVTARCDAGVRAVVEGELGIDRLVRLREGIRGVVCSSRGLVCLERDMDDDGEEAQTEGWTRRLAICSA
ncbi:uncharacterized protein BO97DRAFT_352086 [Aspergillus homomorphus CBS 101889]|uniref:DUF7730 domain-containing protein n=1 Tax=Aspergillus homomorphus (strain CBS 101889) TaxID=1450537 RepID=A0A395HNJ2_ASPHC|nr:hypothetical protein BO97DRAFT_352086 [Aspergillus homomorphus CBS 101889]RAL09320.1 hypothetical protein BO97DRAFT_352086 [Aspergillus homomorphus CBS 101889]